MVSNQDTDKPPQVAPAVVRAPAELHGGRWTHLVGVFDRTSNAARLFVNGNYIGDATRFPSWNATGLFRIGRQMGSAPNQFEGVIDDVRVYDRVLTADAVRALVAKDNVQAAHWRFDEETGTTASNAVEGGDAAVLRGGAVFSADAQVNRAVKLGAPVITSPPVVR